MANPNRHSGVVGTVQRRRVLRASMTAVRALALRGSPRGSSPSAGGVLCVR